MAQVLSNLPIGAKVKFGKFLNADLIWIVADKNHTGYPANSVTLFAEKIIYELAFDAKESNAVSGAIVDGNTHYGYSTLRQWLNSNATEGKWYSAQYTGDAPPSSTSVVSKNPYSSWAGFLNAFSAREQSAILDTTVAYRDDDEVVLTSVDKMFLIGGTELGRPSAIQGQIVLSLFGGTNAFSPTAKYTAAYRALNPSIAENKTGDYWLRDTSNNLQKMIMTGDGTTNHGDTTTARGVRPLTNITALLNVSDVTDSDGCYTILWNSAPIAPSLVSAPATVYGGKSNAISWTTSSDPEGDTVTYQLECSIDNGAYATIYTGTATTYSHLVPFGATFVAYRVKATDPSGESSAYTVSATKTVVNNNAPVISGTDTNLGVSSSGFIGSYTIEDANNDPVTVTEAIDGVQIRALVATLNTPIPYYITGNTWLALPNGSHTFTITATDGIDTSVRTYVFTKLVDKFTIRNSTPWISTTRPSRIMLVISRNIPSGAKFKVEVCNNGLQGSPTWEDCTAAVESGLVHVFSNQSNSAASWGVLVRVTVERNGAAGACYVSAIGGNWE